LLFASSREQVVPALVLGGGLIVGRQPPPGGAALLVHAVSKEHARFSIHNGSWIVTDLSSRNGTFVNGHRVDRAPLVDGDQIRMGDAIFKFVSDGADGFASHRADGSESPPKDASSEDIKGGFQMSQLLALVARVAPTDLNVLVLGETGTGKELVARAIHRASGRRGRMAAINCAAIPAGLIESELFGFKRGAFTGASQNKTGLVGAASGGTLFLDEIGDMPLDAQTKLLRVLETREVVPLGATQGEKVDIRLVCATHRRLDELVASGAFRGDLYARINGCAIALPPLRDRKEDVFLLADHFAQVATGRLVPMTFRFVEALLAYDWPFNVRELDTVMRRAVALAGDAKLDIEHLPEAVRTGPRYSAATRGSAANEPAPSSSPPAAQGLSASPPPHKLQALLEKHKGNIAAIARELGKDRAQVHRWLKYVKMDPKDFR
jgi:transcriptional regulator with PAS, ATPase and Fis domain